MSYPLLLSVLTLLAIIATPGQAAWRTSLISEAEYAASTDDGHTQKGELTLLPEVHWRATPRARLTAIGRLRADAYDRLEPGQPEQPAISDGSRRYFHGDNNETELREFYLDLDPGFGYLRIGKQQVVWGRADGLKVLDMVNPQSFREFILDDFDSSRIPLWKINWEIPAAAGQLQLLWIPDRTYNDLPESDALFAFRSPQLVPGPPPEGVNVEVEPLTRPDRPLRDAAAGLRWSAFLGGWDLSLNYLYHYHPNPVPFREIEGSDITVSPRYERTHLIGGTFTNAFGSYTIRGELGYSTHRFFVAESDVPDGVVESPELATVLGLDWQGPSDTMLSGQIFQSLVDASRDDIVRRPVQTDVTFLARRQFFYQTLTAQVIAIHNLDMDDGLLRPALTWDYRSNVTLRLGADIFYGDQDGRYGQFRELDRVVLGVSVAL